jgi:xanthine dehydrogenase iron-sulfur cluster and FAD-binding subunit A
MHTCLAYSALLQAEEVIDLLLEAAKYDPRHREMMKVTSKVNALVFYEPVRLCSVDRLFELVSISHKCASFTRRCSLQ